MKPKRIQLSRRKGYRKPPGTIVVARPFKYGNPFTVAGCRAAGYVGTDAEIANRCVDAFEAWLGPHWRENWDCEESERRRAWMLAHLPDLRRHDLACWCPLTAPCHADVLLRLANKTEKLK